MCAAPVGGAGRRQARGCAMRRRLAAAPLCAFFWTCGCASLRVCEAEADVCSGNGLHLRTGCGLGWPAGHEAYIYIAPDLGGPRPTWPCRSSASE